MMRFKEKPIFEALYNDVYYNNTSETVSNLTEVFKGLIGVNNADAIEVLVGMYPALLEGINNPSQKLKNLSEYTTLYVDNINAEDVEAFCSELLETVPDMEDKDRKEKIISLMSESRRSEYEILLLDAY